MEPATVDGRERPTRARHDGARRRRVVRRAARRAITPDPVSACDDARRRRAMLADYLRMLAWWVGRPPMPMLSPRLDQALRALLAGDAEKQVAARLGVSVHTAHAYVKEIYRRAGVTSRGELLTRFLPTLSPGADASADVGATPLRGVLTRTGTL